MLRMIPGIAMGARAMTNTGPRHGRSVRSTSQASRAAIATAIDKEPTEKRTVLRSVCAMPGAKSAP
jgi:hypothetical protein